MHSHPHSDTGSRTSSDGPRLVFWETTAACNLECVHCRRLDVARELARDDLTTAEARALIVEIAKAGTAILVFSGGEPLMRPDLFELAMLAREYGLIIALASNGTMIDATLAGRIAGVGFHRVSVSLDGATAATHDVLRQQPGAFDRAVNALEALHAAGVPTQLNCTIARHNANELAEVLALGERVGVDAVHYFLLVPVGCGEQIAEDQMLSAEETDARLAELCELAASTRLEIKATCAPHYYRIVRQKRKADPASAPPLTATHGHHAMTKGCLAGTAVCFISHKGEVFPCGYLPVEAGNVRQIPFSVIWRDSEVFARLRDPSLLTGKCGECEYRGVCGGCRARAFYEYGDYLHEEPFCTYQPAARTRKG
ncbi:MAG: radical SAM protein [Phycisphaerae bacterium]|nr:radical SAM protein [Phycisphaerae bacterium]